MPSFLHNSLGSDDIPVAKWLSCRQPIRGWTPLIKDPLSGTFDRLIKSIWYSATLTLTLQTYEHWMYLRCDCLVPQLPDGSIPKSHYSWWNHTVASGFPWISTRLRPQFSSLQYLCLETPTEMYFWYISICGWYHAGCSRSFSGGCDFNTNTPVSMLPMNSANHMDL